MPLLAEQSIPKHHPADWWLAISEIVQFWPVLAFSFGASLLLTPLMRKLALANGIVDLPDVRRKAHAKPVAYLGGLAIFLGWFVGLCVFVVMLFSVEERTIRNYLSDGPISIAYVALGAAAIVLTGLFDDVYGIRARVKIGGQLFAAAALAQTNSVNDLLGTLFNIADLGGMPEPIMQIIGTILIAVLVVGCCNALNLIDGLDGLASGVTAIAMAGMLTICMIIFARFNQDAVVVAQLGIPIVLTLATIGAVIGFLPFNFNPAKIFMGDTGSLLLGYLCVTTILFMGRIDNDQALAPMAFAGAIICFALPMTDTALAIVRRKLNGRPIFAPDAMHMHHMFRRCGLTVKQTAFAMYGIGLLFAGTGVSFFALELRWRTTLGIFLLTVIVILAVGYLVSRRLEATEQAHPKPAEAPGQVPPSNSKALEQN